MSRWIFLRNTCIPTTAGLWMASLLACSANPTWAQSQENQPTPEGIQFFETKIRPVLVEHCYRCHSNDGVGTRGGLAVDSRDALLAGGESGPSIVPGNLEDSVLWDAITYKGLKMPPKNPLPKEVIEDFRKWILMGAPDTRVATGTIIHSKVTAEDIEKGKEFWAFKKPEKASAPSDPTGWAKTDIDRFIASSQQEQRLKPAPDADATTFLRRVYLDLIGLPPTIQEITDFTAAYQKDADQAVEQTVDQLLKRPQFGERWGRHWLDVARYAESSGKEVDVTYPHAWRYRNYVIDAFNQDKPYDQFLREQLAGDLLRPTNDQDWAENLIATGFLAIGPKALIEQNPRQFQADLIDEQIDTTTRVMLGVSVACARCHDHKFDPIPQLDYYRLAGIFQSTETYYGGERSQRNRQPSNQIILPIDDPNPGVTAMSKSELDDLKKEVKKRQEEAIEARRAQRQPQNDKDAGRNLLNAAVLDQLVAVLNNRLHSVDDNGKPLTFCMGVQDSDRIRNARVLVRGEIDQPAQEVDRGFVQVLCNSDVKLQGKSSGRLELANWIANKDNPLTARVMVNRLWQHMLGQGIVNEPDNFGASGPAPTHPMLLDYLAVRFIEQGWSIKKLVKEIAMSRTYRLSSQFDEGQFEQDPENKYLSRFRPRRIDAEALRDSMLAISGQIDLRRPKASTVASFGSTMIGPNGPALPPGALQALTSMSSGTGTMSPGTMQLLRGMRGGTTNPLEAPFYHRSVYLPIVRNALPRSLDVFDFAESSIVVGQREESNTADQALYMLNNSFVMEQSDAIARRVMKMSSSPNDRLATAFLLIYGRKATSQEMQACQEFVRKAGNAASGRNRDEKGFSLLSELCQALMASAEFRYVN